jgi:hypothetical protein
MAMGRRARLPVAGFVLPTVTMVLLVVILLTVAITLRSFDRGNIARNVRVNQQVLAAATPALDRAKAKIQFMLYEDPQRPTATPSDNEMYRMMSSAGSTQDIYTFGGEERLTLKYDLNESGAVDAPANPPDAETDEEIKTAWKYRVDTNNNGKFDTYTLYGIYFRSPERRTQSPDAGSFVRARKPLEARTPPMTGKIADPRCAVAAGTSASLVGNSGWYKSEGKLKKSFFVYTVNLPITNPDPDPNKNEEAFKGTTSFSALEYQQDQTRVPLSNNAVVYEDDLEISAGVDFRINGRMFTNSNFFATAGEQNGSVKTLKLFQVSSPASCFYEQENSKIIVSGNAVNAGVVTPGRTVTVDLFTQGGQPTTTTLTSSATTGPLDVLYNNQAYSDRLSTIVDEWITLNPGNNTSAVAADPVSVQQLTKGPDFVTSRRRALEGYFKARLRKVPFGDTTSPPSSVIQGTGDTLGPATEWNLLKNGDTAITGDLTGPTGITLVDLQALNPIDNPINEQFLGDRIQVGNNLPEQRWDNTSTPPKFIGLEPAQQVVGSTWQDGSQRTRTPRVTQLADVGSTDRAGFWELAAAEAPKTPVDGVGGLRVVTGGGVYERVNSFLPPPGWDDPTTTPIEASPTYNDPATSITETYPIVWPDTMPMSPVLGVQKVFNNDPVNADTVPNAPANSWATDLLPPSSADLPAGSSTIDPSTRKYAKGDLRMRATAVYHYANNAYDPTTPDPGQTPIGCISSYYDPSSSLTSRNISSLANVSGDTLLVVPPRDAIIGSNNGIVYGPPNTARPGASVPDATTGLLGGMSPSELEKQANYVFPNGRFANEPLRNALTKDPSQRTLADIAAIDATMCSFGILGTTSFTLGARPDIDDGAIKEVAFLNGRDIKAIDRNDINPATSSPTTVDETFTLSSPLTGNEKAYLAGKYELALEERQPLEIRATVLDIEELRTKTIPQTIATGPSPEYLLPNSGIIYATRDDALPDRSARQPNPTTNELDQDKSKTVSPTDSRLDPTRRPNAIMLIKGEKLFRGGATPATVSSVEEVVKEKGLTLVSNLPVYIKGEFNQHTKEEFSDASLATDWNNFYTRNVLDTNFACRKGDPRLACGTGDDWRPATVLGDSVTILSGDFREGFRNEGDFDLRNNAGGATFAPSTVLVPDTTPTPHPATELRRNQGLYNNNFVTNGLSSGAFDVNGVLDGGGTRLTDNSYLTINGNGLNSSYFNNFVTPIQRRGNYPEYLMEVCTKLPVSACTEKDWYVDPTPGTLLKATAALVNTSYDPGTHKAGTTAELPDPTLQRFPRRVAFQRDNTDKLENATPTKVLALGINGTGNIDAFDTSTAAVPRATTANSLWFASATAPESLDFDKTNPLFFLNAVNLPNPDDGFQFTDGTKQPPRFSSGSPFTLDKHPLLMPVLQISHATDTAPAPGTLPPEGQIVEGTKWLQPVPATPNIQEFNLIVGSGDVPSRKIVTTTTAGEFNGGLQNLPRFIENWRDGAITTKIVGAFIQLNRSAYSTAPFLSRLANSPPRSVFSPKRTGTELYPLNSYKTSNGGGSIPFFSPPGRNWGFDVGILSQPPDLFTQRFTAPSTKTKPAEFFKEVPRNDEWVQTLMCAFDAAGTTPVVSSDLRPTNSFCIQRAGA